MGIGLNMSFKVFASARPIRTAFLLDETPGFDAACDSLISWGVEVWGGRRSPIALIEHDGALSEDAWQEMIRFDPDQVCSFVPVSDELLRKLDAEFAPWHVTAPKECQPSSKVVGASSGDAEDTAVDPETCRERIRAAGIPVPPVKRNLEVFQNRPLLMLTKTVRFSSVASCTATWARITRGSIRVLARLAATPPWEIDCQTFRLCVCR
jgi:hypothetical protein